MKLKLLFLLFTFAFLLFNAKAQNVGIGIDTPQAKLHVNGDFRILNGATVHTISPDSSFNPGSDNILPTQKAIKRYVEKGSWFPQSAMSPALLGTNTVNFGNISMSVRGSYAYILSESLPRLTTYDISNPGNIV